MKRLGLWFALAVTTAACGDNSQECGPGTDNVDGVCTPSGSGSICGDGTTLDPVSHSCVPSSTVCGGGTVLVNGTCQDPTAGLTIDLEEGPEPNGTEPNATLAGTIVLKPVGDPKGFVVHGCVKPVSDFADLDVYKLSVTGPTLVDVTADGVQGLAAGFVTIGTDPALGNWQRFGINLANDMSHREVYLPSAGSYEFVMSDTRSLLGLVDGATDTLEPAGNPDGTSCYYVTLNQLAIPAASALPIPAGITAPLDGKIHFYTGQMPTGYIDLVETVDSTHAGPAAELIVSDQLRAVDSGGQLFFGGITATDTTVVAADFVYNYGIEPANFTLTFDAASSAQALPTDGSVLASTVNGNSFSFPNFSTVNQYYFDVATANQTYGMSLAFSKGVQGVISDAGGTFVGTYGGLTPTNTFTTYKGLWRAPHAGRYYLVVFDPTDAVATAFTVTSTLTPLTPGAVVVGTPLTAQAPNAFDSNPYTLDITNNIWDSFNATGAGTGNLTVAMFDPATTFGRLDTLTLSTGPSPGTAPLLTYTFPAAGALAGYITKTLGINNVLVKVNAATTAGTPTFTLDFAARVFTNLGDIVAPHTTTNNGDTSPANGAHRYYFTTTPGNKVTITVHPTTVIQDPTLVTLNPNESTNLGGTGNNAAVGADEVIQYVQDASGFTAFSVSGALGVAQTYNLTVDVTPPFYTKHTTATAFADACTGGTVVALSDPDEGVSAPQTTPAGFTFYGATNTQYVISSNGYISFDITNNGHGYPNPIPDGVGAANIMPLAEDLDLVHVCTKVSGTKTIIQWTGQEFDVGQGTVPVQFQAILDTADGSIELVYGPNNASDGTLFGGIGGVQDPTGAQATETGNGNTAAFAAANSSVKLTHP